jgi:hypothetical protein
MRASTIPQWRTPRALRSSYGLIATITFVYLGAVGWSAARPLAVLDLADAPTRAHVRIVNGVLLHNEAPFSGVVTERFSDGRLKRQTPYRRGRREGEVVAWHENGRVAERRAYEGGLEHGMHDGWYPDGSARFAYRYVRGRADGDQREWYANGTPFTAFTYRDGQESGRQRMWTEAGVLRANYVVDHGRRFGLMGTTGCSGLSHAASPALGAISSSATTSVVDEP